MERKQGDDVNRRRKTPHLCWRERSIETRGGGEGRRVSPGTRRGKRGELGT